MSEEYRHLKDLLAGYFHQDWKSDHDTAIAAIECYLGEWPSGEVSMAVKEIRQLLLDTKSEDELRVTALRLGCYYEPRADALTYREWLTSVCERLSV
ncbi:contact-dependent growth inhibition system immunity protein [Methyloversatilis sp.]|uniref:contact-dependent growth inhibition system immunity protein n=1 Tax=Methyloversatilis sp. TaxID=2569862 RepID=UPI003D29A2CF